MISSLSDVIIGTAQFGLNYGVSNVSGKTDSDEIDSMLDFANKNDMYVFDTSPDYGDAHDVLIRSVTKDGRKKINSKISSIKSLTTEELISSIKKTCDQFKGNLNAILFHSPDDIYIDGYKEVLQEVNNMKRNKLFNKIGVSIYDKEQLIGFTDNLKIDVVQIPFNVFDHRFSMDKDLFHKDMEVQVRSIFLQGLLIMPIELLPKSLIRYRNLLERFYAICKKYNMDRYDVCIKWAQQQNWIDKIVVGFNNLEQLKMFKKSFYMANNIEDIDLHNLYVDDKKLINPSNWK